MRHFRRVQSRRCKGSHLGVRISSLVVAVAAAVAALPAVGCAPEGGERLVEVVLPATPPAVRPQGYRIEWIDGSGAPRWTVVAEEALRFYLRLSLRSGTPVAAYPILSNGVFPYRPAGAVFPNSVAPGERLHLSWREGFLAERYLRLWERGVSVETVNTAKLMKRIQTVGGSDPWRVDAVRLESDIARRTLSAASVRLLPTRTVDVDLPTDGAASGPWIPQSALALPLIPGLMSVELSLGYHSLLNATSGRVVSLWVGEIGDPVLVTTWPRY